MLVLLIALAAADPAPADPPPAPAPAPAAAPAPAPAPAEAPPQPPAPAPALVVTPAPPKPAHAASAAPAKTRLLVLETRADDSVVAKVKGYGDLLAALLEPRITAEIVPSTSVRDRIGVVSDKLSAGCDETACMAEIAGALDARYVLTTRASQVGGRWALRAEIFDSETLSVIAQATRTSDSVEGLASGADATADALVAGAPMLGKKALPPPAPVEAKHGPVLPWVIAGSGVVLAAGSVAAYAVTYVSSSDAQKKLATARAAYDADPSSTANRTALATEGRAAASATNTHYIVAPIGGCLAVPFLGVAVGGTIWGAASGGDEAAP